MSSSVKTVAIIGSGVIGSGWAARCLAHGLDVVAFDPAPDGEAKIRAAIANAWPALETAGLAPGASQTRLTYVSSVADAVKHADFIQENAPEREELKQKLLAEIDSHAKPGAVIASSTSYLLPTSLQKLCKGPSRIVVGHPFNPVYLLPLVEIVAGEKTSSETVEAAKNFYRRIGMRPLHVRKEIEGFIDDMDGVEESAVIGIPHPDFGEAVMAIVVPKVGAKLNAEQMIATLKTQIANFKIPKRLEIVSDLPRNAMGKVQKNILRQQYSA